MVRKLEWESFPYDVEDETKPAGLSILAFLKERKFEFQMEIYQLPLAHLHLKLTDDFPLFFTSNSYGFVWRWNVNEIKLWHSQVFAYCHCSWVPSIKNISGCITNWKNWPIEKLFNSLFTKSLTIFDRKHKNLNLHEPNFKGHRCTSIGKFSRFMGQAAFIVNLNRTSNITVKIDWLSNHNGKWKPQC